MKTPKVSVLMSTYNGKDTIAESIESVLQQSFQDFEFIIINDCSTNTVASIIDSYIKRDKRIRYIENEKNLGLTKSLNKGMQEARGQYIARIDDDDIWSSPEKLKKQVDFLDTHPDYVLVGTNVVIVDSEGKELTRKKQIETDQDIRNHLIQSNQFTHSAVLFRKDITLEIGGYDEHCLVAQDYNFRLKLGMKGKLHNLQIFATKFRSSAQSISKKKAFKQKISAWKSAKKYAKVYPRPTISLLLRLFHLLLPKKIFTFILHIGSVVWTKIR